jgi:hypothetical protein
MVVKIKILTKLISSKRKSKAMDEDFLNDDTSRTCCASSNLVPITIVGGESYKL